VINMPRRKQHREFTLRKYGVTGDDIHKWTDERYQDLGVRHRQERHARARSGYPSDLSRSMDYVLRKRFIEAMCGSITTGNG
jgi:hypothetical protein